MNEINFVKLATMPRGFSKFVC